MNYETLYTQAMELNTIAREMKLLGIPIDQERRAWHRERLRAERVKAKAEFLEIVSCYVQADESIDLSEEGVNLNSHQQIQDIFYNKLHMRVRPQYVSKKTGKPGVGKGALRDAIIEGTGDLRLAALALRDYREADKYEKDFVGDGYTGEPGHYGLKVHRSDGRVHYNFNPCAASTMRWTSDGQQVPKDQHDADGKLTRHGLRDMYIAPDGWEILEADYNQMQMRIFGLFAGVNALIKTFNTEGGDAHGLTAAALMGIPPESFDKKKHKGIRNLAKTANFGGILFGGSDEVVHAQIAPKYPKLTVLEVANMKIKVFKAMPEIPQYQRDQIHFANLRGYTPIPGEDFTIFWRFGELNGTPIGDPKSTEIVNTRIQTKEALIANRALIRTTRRVKAEWPDERTRPKLFLQFHDAQYWFVRPEHRERLAVILKEEMYEEQTYLVNYMSYPVDCKYGSRWGAEMVGC